MTNGTLLVLWSARLALVLYAGSLAAWLIGKPQSARLAWTSGFCVYLLHVAAAFQFRHHWSHAAAYQETARQTAELFGVRWGGGLYFNYGFTAVWVLAVIWIWRSPEAFRRQLWIVVAVHSFMAFMFFNAAVVFVAGWVRWVGLIIGISLGVLWWRTRKKGTRGSFHTLQQ